MIKHKKVAIFYVSRETFNVNNSKIRSSWINIMYITYYINFISQVFHNHGLFIQVLKK